MMSRSRARPLLSILALASVFVLAPSAAHAREYNPILMYLPNRVFDLLDIVRARVRVGPGVALGVRATEAVDAEIGAYTSVFAGVPGPRGRRRVNLPAGLENYTGAEVSVASGGSDSGFTGPNYGTLELGAGFQAGLVGLDFGVDPGELADFVTGLLFIDLVEDDL